MEKKIRDFVSIGLLVLTLIFSFSCGNQNTEIINADFPIYGEKEIEIGVFSSPAPTQEAYDECAEAGFTYVLIDENYYSRKDSLSAYKNIMKYCANSGMKSYVMTFQKDDLNDYNDVEGYTGKFFWDEPKISNFDEIASWIDGFEEQNGQDKVFLNNLFPYFGKHGAANYEQYISGYIEKILNKLSGKKILQVDIYPLFEGARSRIVDTGYLYNLETTAELTKGTNIDVSYYVQTHGFGVSGNLNRNVESVADMRFQYNCLMAYGVKQFVAFTYPNQSGADFRTGYGLVKNVRDGLGWTTERNDVYYYVKQANEELKAWDNIYLSFDYVGTKTFIGDYNADGYNDCFDMLVHEKENLNGIKEVTCTQDTIIGEFKFGNTSAFMVTNFVEPSSSKSDKVILSFEKANKVQVYLNGKMEEKMLINGKIALNLQSGEGAFIVVA